MHVPRLASAVLAVAMTTKQWVLTSAATHLEENMLENNSGGGLLGSFFSAQKDMQAELRKYKAGAGGVHDQGGKGQSSPLPDRAAGHSEPGGSTRYQRPVRSKYPELLDEGDSMRLKIRVDLVLVGFQEGKDDLLNIPHETLELWLENLSSVVRHATVAAEHTSSPALGGRAKVQGQSPRSNPTPTPDVEYAYQFHVVDVHKKVRDALEAHMRTYLRNEQELPGVEPETGQQRPSVAAEDGGRNRHMYMPTWHMENLLGSLVSALETPSSGLNTEGELPTAFTLFILNPRPAWALPSAELKDAAGGEATYGYRCGLSASAMAALAADTEVVQRAEVMEREEQVGWRVVEYRVSDDPLSSGVKDRESPPELSSYRAPKDSTESSLQWALDRLNDIPERDTDQGVDSSEESSTHSWSLSQEKAFLLKGGSKVPPTGRARILLRDVLEVHRRGGGSRGATGGAGVNGDGDGDGGVGSGCTCLTETWVSERFAWIDLQAGPFEWGAAAGDGGYKSAASGLLPRHLQRGILPARPGSAGGGRRDGDYVRALENLRGKVSARISRLAALKVHMSCGDEEENKMAGTRRGDSRRLGVAAVACEEVSSQLAFLRRFQTREGEVVSNADAAAAAEGVAPDGRGKIDKSEEFTNSFRAFQRSHIALLHEVLEELAPATESDSPSASLRSEAAGLGAEQQAVLSRLAALVSSLQRSVITPASTLPLPALPPPKEPRNSTRPRNPNGDNHAVSPSNLYGDLSGCGTSSACAETRSYSLYKLPTGPALVSQAQAGGVGPTTAAAAGARGHGPRTMSSAHPLLSPPPPSALEYFFPESLAFTLYVVRAQDVYPPLGTPSPSPEGAANEAGAADGGGRGKQGQAERALNSKGAASRDGKGHNGKWEGDAATGSSGFDLLAFQEGAMSLKLRSQQASFTMLQVDTATDPVIAAALAGAKRESSVDVVTADGVLMVDRRVYIDSASLHHQLNGRPDEDAKEAVGGAEEDARRFTKHITIWLFSLAGAESVYVDEKWRARAVGGDTVVVAQSEPRRGRAPPLTCGGRAVEEDPRNPLREALAAVASIVGGLVPAQDSWDEARGGGVVHDWRWSMSESPMSPLVPHARFSKLDQDVMYRTHIVSALSASAKLTRAGSSILFDAVSRETSRNVLEGTLFERFSLARSSLREACAARANVPRNADLMDFDNVVRALNGVLDQSRRAYREALKLDSDVIAELRGLGGDGTEGTSTTNGTTLWGKQGGVIRLLLALAVAAGAAWLLMKASSSGPSARNRKRVKVN